MTNATRVLLLPLLLLLGACAGQTARDNVQLPALASTWGRLRPAVERELAATPNPTGAAALVQADQAFAAGTPSAIAVVPWSVLDDLARADTDRRLAAGEIGPGVAESRRGLIDDFARSRALYLRAPQ